MKEPYRHSEFTNICKHLYIGNQWDYIDQCQSVHGWKCSTVCKFKYKLSIDCGKEAVEVYEINLLTVLPQFRAQCSLLCTQLTLCSCIMMFLAVHRVLPVFVRNDVPCL